MYRPAPLSPSQLTRGYGILTCFPVDPFRVNVESTLPRLTLDGNPLVFRPRARPGVVAHVSGSHFPRPRRRPRGPRRLRKNSQQRIMCCRSFRVHGLAPFSAPRPAPSPRRAYCPPGKPPPPPRARPPGRRGPPGVTPASFPACSEPGSPPPRRWGVWDGR